jgi:hypothetical protein
VLNKRYVHYSRNSEIALYDKPGVRQNFKPMGLWITDETDQGWLSWCKREEFGTGNHIFDVELNPVAKIKQIDTLEKLDDFAREYRYNPFDPDGLSQMDWIDWASVLVDYDGIMIFPHFYQRHLDFIWYNAWDCASGCLFRPTLCIKSITYRGITEGE